MAPSKADTIDKYYDIPNEDEGEVRPVYVLNSVLAPSDYSGYISNLEVLRSCEQIVGEDEGIHAIVRTGGLWRIYPCTEFGRERLMIEGIDFMGCTIQLSDRNPFDDGTTKLFIGGLPLNK